MIAALQAWSRAMLADLRVKVATWFGPLAATAISLLGCDDTHDSCSTNGDCASNQSCVYRISDGCSAHATCQDKPTGILCGAIIEYCGCDGNMVGMGCSEPGGYASAPVSSTSGTCPAATDAASE